MAITANVQDHSSTAAAANDHSYIASAADLRNIDHQLDPPFDSADPRLSPPMSGSSTAISWTPSSTSPPLTSSSWASSTSSFSVGADDDDDDETQDTLSSSDHPTDQDCLNDDHSTVDAYNGNSSINKLIISTSHDYVPLSKEALSLLHYASRDVAASRNLRKRIKIGDDTESRNVIATLYEQLESLRELVPVPKQPRHESVCVISATLHYLEDLRKKVRSLEDHIKLSNAAVSGSEEDQCRQSNIGLNAACIATDPSTTVVQVERINPPEGDIRIVVTCRKRPGLLADLMLSLESIGLLLDSMDFSCHGGKFSFQAMAAHDQVSCKKSSIIISEETVRRAIMNTIYNNSNSIHN